MSKVLVACEVAILVFNEAEIESEALAKLVPSLASDVDPVTVPVFVPV